MTIQNNSNIIISRKEIIIRINKNNYPSFSDIVRKDVKMSNIKDVAALAGVSVPTVYKVFSSNQYASPAVEEKVFEAARQLGYVHKAAQKSVQKPGAGNSEKTIAIIIDDVTNPFYSFMINEIRKGLQRYGYHLIIISNAEDRNQENSDIQALLECKADALIFIPALGEKQAVVNRLIAAGYPLLQLFRPLYENIDTILIDDVLGGYLAVKYLLQSGHRRIMLITRSNPLLVKREEGYKKAFQEAGVPVDEDCLCFMTYIDNIKDVLKEKIQAVKPTAIVSVGEKLSVNTIQALREMNYSIPDDVSLIVYDDLAWTAAFDITTVSHSFETIGNLASELIVGRLKEMEGTERQPVARLTLDPKLVLRNSVKIL